MSTNRLLTGSAPMDTTSCLSPNSTHGIDDDAVLLKSRSSNAVLVTADKDFGELVFRQRLLHSGVVLIRLAGLEAETKAKLVAAAFEQHADELKLGFAVLSRRALRLRKRRV